MMLILGAGSLVFSSKTKVFPAYTTDRRLSNLLCHAYIIASNYVDVSLPVSLPSE